MAKKRLIHPPIALRVDPATRANIDTIIESGIAKDASAALRAGAAALARGLVDDPRVWVIHSESERMGRRYRVCSTEDKATTLLAGLGATQTDTEGRWWEREMMYGDEGDMVTYFIECVLL